MKTLLKISKILMIVSILATLVFAALFLYADSYLIILGESILISIYASVISFAMLIYVQEGFSFKKLQFAIGVFCIICLILMLTFVEFYMSIKGMFLAFTLLYLSSSYFAFVGNRMNNKMLIWFLKLCFLYVIVITMFHASSEIWHSLSLIAYIILAVTMFFASLRSRMVH